MRILTSFKIVLSIIIVLSGSFLIWKAISSFTPRDKRLLQLNQSDLELINSYTNGLLNPSSCPHYLAVRGAGNNGITTVQIQRPGKTTILEQEVELNSIKILDISVTEIVKFKDVSFGRFEMHLAPILNQELLFSLASPIFYQIEDEKVIKCLTYFDKPLLK